MVQFLSNFKHFSFRKAFDHGGESLGYYVIFNIENIDMTFENKFLSDGYKLASSTQE